MRRRLSCAVATASMTTCAICHVWTAIQVLRVWVRDDLPSSGIGPSIPFMIAYMAAVCLFNCSALTSGSAAYRQVALVSTGVHLVGALVQGAAAEAILLGGSSDSWIRIGVALPSVLNLPMNSTEVIHQISSLLPWGTAVFFALNLVVLIVRMRKTAEYID